MFLLLPFSPVSVLKDPLPCSRQELPTTLGAGDTNESKAPFSIHPTDMFEAQKFESLRSPQSVSLTCHARESPKEYAPSLFLGQLQTEFREPLPHLLLEMVHVLSILETHHEVSSPGEFHPEALSELYVSLSTHTAPAMEPRRTPIRQ